MASQPIVSLLSDIYIVAEVGATDVTVNGMLIGMGTLDFERVVGRVTITTGMILFGTEFIFRWSYYVLLLLLFIVVVVVVVVFVFIGVVIVVVVVVFVVVVVIVVVVIVVVVVVIVVFIGAVIVVVVVVAVMVIRATHCIQ